MPSCILIPVCLFSSAGQGCLGQPGRVGELGASPAAFLHYCETKVYGRDVLTILIFLTIRNEKVILSTEKKIIKASMPLIFIIGIFSFKTFIHFEGPHNYLAQQRKLDTR